MVAVNPAEAAFRQHLAGASYRLGAAAHRWRAHDVAWPHAVFGVRASDGIEYGLRFDCRDYPRTPPTARPWDIERNAPLAVDAWPTGAARVPMAFNPSWKNGSCLYLPCDGQSIEGHANWYTEHPALIWNPTVGVVHYLRVVHDLLNSGDYRGRRVA